MNNKEFVMLRSLNKKIMKKETAHYGRLEKINGIKILKKCWKQ